MSAMQAAALIGLVVLAATGFVCEALTRRQGFATAGIIFSAALVGLMVGFLYAAR